MLKIERVTYRGWQDCLHLFNEKIELIVTTVVGPRIIRFGFLGGENEFKEFPEQLGLTGGTEWHSFGGHRLWHAPESIPRTYVPDNVPVQVVEQAGVVRLTGTPEAGTGICKEIEIRMDPERPRVVVSHRLTNAGLWPVRLSVWALSVVETGGVSFFPLPPYQGHDENLLPVSCLALWGYTNFTDPRWTLGSRFVMLRQDPNSREPQKIGAYVPDGWAAYARNGHVFVKQVSCIKDAPYPDYCSPVELYTEASFSEIETLSPLTELKPGETAEHVETWSLLEHVPQPGSEAELIQNVLPEIEKRVLKAG